MEELSSHWTDFRAFLYLSIFRKSIEKIQALLKCDKNKWYFIWRPIYVHLWYLDEIFLKWEMFQTDLYRKSKYDTLYSKIFLRKSCHLWDNVQKYSRAGQAADDNTIRPMHFACWVTKATDTHPEYVILFAFSTITLVMRTRLDVTFMHKMPLFYVHDYRVRYMKIGRFWRTQHSEESRLFRRQCTLSLLSAS